MNPPEKTDYTDRNFRGQQKAEKVLCFCRKHPIVLVRIVLVTIILFTTSITTFLIIPVDRMRESIFIQAILFALVIMGILTFHMFFLRLLNFYLNIVIITNYRIIDLRKSLFIHDDKEIIDLHEIQDTKKIQKGILANFLNYGDIIVVIPSLTTSMHLHYIPKPEYHLNRINQSKRGYILDRRRQKVKVTTHATHPAPVSSRTATSPPTSGTVSPFHHETSHKEIQYGPKPDNVNS